MSFWYLPSILFKRKKINLTTMVPQLKLFAFVFLGELKTTKRHFEINRPLDAINKFQKHTTLKNTKTHWIKITSPFITPSRLPKGQVNLRAITDFLPFSQNYDFRKTFILALQIAMQLLMIAPTDYGRPVRK